MASIVAQEWALLFCLELFLGDYTIVGAGSIVSQLFSEGYCVIAGNPARLIKMLEKGKCIFFKSEFEYNGYIKAEDFEKFSKRELLVFRLTVLLQKLFLI